MRFKTKDLLVTVLPTAKNLDPEVAKRCLLQTNICARPTFQCPDPSLICRNPSVCLAPTHCGGCSLLVSCEPCSGIGTCRHSVCDCTFIASLPCGGLSCGGGSACDPTLPCGVTNFVIESPEDLVAIRDELRATLKQLEKFEAEGLPPSIGSLAEAEQLEAGLEEALKQVRAQKKNLK